MVQGHDMSTTLEANRAASLTRMAMLGVGAFIVLLAGGAIALWLTLGTAVFFEVVAAGIAYCF
jgi:hypothetical protein